MFVSKDALAKSPGLASFNTPLAAATQDEANQALNYRNNHKHLCTS